MIKRELDLSKFKTSFFLFGPRQVGKTFLIENTLSPDIFINLLRKNEFLKYSQAPDTLLKEINSLNKKDYLVVIDEIQKCPDLLNEVQILMSGNETAKFVLTGSSARKLKRAGVNLLGGRAITLHLHPFTSDELKGQFDLQTAIKFGTIPKIHLEKDLQNKIRLLKSYIETYLEEEIQLEALTKNIPAFAKFLELSAHENGNILNFKNISREVGVDSKTIKEYFNILSDTLIGFFIYPYSSSHRKRLVSHPKFYFFDCGVVSALKNELHTPLSQGTPPYGRVFEHFIVLEIIRILSYYEIEAKLSFFRTADGAEVDLILEIGGNIWAIEIKASATPSLSDIRGLLSFMSDHKVSRAFCVCKALRSFKDSEVDFIPWELFLSKLKDQSPI